MKAYIEPDEVTMMEKVASNLRDKILIRLLFRLGCRVSEALALKVEDIDFAHGTVTIIHLKRRVKLSCANCGARLGVSHSFCPKCGVRINETT
jgi:integrase/recombinase XerD